MTWLELICAFAGLVTGTLIAGLVAWHQGTLSYFIGGLS